MKKLKLIALVVLVAMLATSAFAVRAPKSAVKGSAHDFMNGMPTTLPYGSTTYNTDGSWHAAGYALCSFCHIAHKFGSAPTGPGYLLWNHSLSTKTSYGVYSSDALATSDIADLGTTASLTTSNLCLSCHDGTVAVNSFYEDIQNATYTGNIPTATKFVDAAAQVSDLTKQHPINFTYPQGTAASNVGLLVPASLSSVDGNGNVPLYNGKMQCDTCHDPHAGPAFTDPASGKPNHLFFRPFPATAAQTATGSFCVYCHT